MIFANDNFVGISVFVGMIVELLVIVLNEYGR